MKAIKWNLTGMSLQNLGLLRKSVEQDLKKTMKRMLAIVGFALVVGSVAWWSYRSIVPKSRARASISKCVVNLHALQELKRIWKDGYNKTAKDTPTWEDIREFASGHTDTHVAGWTNVWPVCPAGGAYKLGQVNEVPTCSVGGPGHAIRKY